MNTIDIIFIIIAIYALYKGFKNGVVVELCGILGIIIGIYIANGFSDDLAAHIDIPKEIGVIVAFVGIFILSIIAVAILARIVSKILSFSGLGSVNGILGAIASLFKIALIVSIIYTSFLAMNQRNGWIDANYVKAAKSTPILRNISHTLFPHVDFIEEYYNLFKTTIIDKE